MFIYLFVLLSEGSGWLGQEGFFHGISELMGTALRNSRKSLGRIFNGIPRPRITHSYINGEPHFVPVATDSWSLRLVRQGKGTKHERRQSEPLWGSFQVKTDSNKYSCIS